jgi:hypothetical protein
MQLIALAAMLVWWGCAAAGEPPSRYGVDAPELAHLGPFEVGFRTLHLVQRGQSDVLAFDAAKGEGPRVDRTLTVDLWYPAQPGAGAARMVYTASLPSEPPAPRRDSPFPALRCATHGPREPACRWSWSPTVTATTRPR